MYPAKSEECLIFQRHIRKWEPRSVGSTGDDFMASVFVCLIINMIKYNFQYLTESDRVYIFGDSIKD